MAPTIIVGHYGSGKTEFAANLVRRMLEKGNIPAIADLDIANPYFRLREKRKYYQALGARVIASNFPDQPHLDAPALSAGLRSCFESDGDSVIDVGGDPAGAAVLARFAHLLQDRPYNLWMVVNANRPATAACEAVEEYIDAIETASRLCINGLINTTHMLRETGVADILRGDALVRAVAAARGLPVRYTVVPEKLLPELREQELAGELFPIRLEMRPDWL